MLKRRNYFQKKDPLIQFKKDLDNFNYDMHDLIDQKEKVEEIPFLQKIASDIIDLYEDSISVEKIVPEAHDIYHLIATPIGAPYVSDMTLLQAAMDFSYQDPQNSSMKKMLQNFM